MLFADRLEVWNPGLLPPPLTLEKLRQPHGSVPANPLLAEPLYLARYIERMGTGIRDMIRRCGEAGLSEPEFQMSDGFTTIIRRSSARGSLPGARDGGAPPESQPESRPELQPESLEMKVFVLLSQGPLGKKEISNGLGQKEVSGQLNKVIRVLLADQTIEQTIPNKPASRMQRYRLTPKGQALLNRFHTGGGNQ